MCLADVQEDPSNELTTPYPIDLGELVHPDSETLLSEVLLRVLFELDALTELERMEEITVISGSVRVERVDQRHTVTVVTME